MRCVSLMWCNTCRSLGTREDVGHPLCRARRAYHIPLNWRAVESQSVPEHEKEYVTVVDVWSPRPSFHSDEGPGFVLFRRVPLSSFSWCRRTILSIPVWVSSAARAAGAGFDSRSNPPVSCNWSWAWLPLCSVSICLSWSELPNSGIEAASLGDESWASCQTIF